MPKLSIFDLIHNWIPNTELTRFWITNIEDDDEMCEIYENINYMLHRQYLNSNEKTEFDNDEECDEFDENIEDSMYACCFIVNWNDNDAQFMIDTFNLPLIQIELENGTKYYLLCLPYYGTSWQALYWDYCSNKEIADQYKNLEFTELKEKNEIFVASISEESFHKATEGKFLKEEDTDTDNDTD